MDSPPSHPQGATDSSHRPAAIEETTGESHYPLPPPVYGVNLRINGESHELQLEAWVTLLDLLRERLGLTGSKKGCDHGQCGA